MCKFLLLVFTLGLASPAFAEEKSPEQLREERSRILGVEGLENQTISRVIASGAKLRIGFFTSLTPDYSSNGDVIVRVTKQPEHGTVETLVKTDYAYYPKENIRNRCNQHKVKGTQVSYKGAEKYTGNDDFELLVLYPTGIASEYHFDISVR